MKTPPILIRRAAQVAALALSAVLAGCASQAPTRNQTRAVQATAEIPREELLDVGIDVLDPGLPGPGEPVPDDLFPELRKAEASYMAIQLRNTLEATGHWGVVRVLPTDRGTADLRVHGTILTSTGSKLVLDVRAFDASNRQWFEKRYWAEADELVYQSAGPERRDPFQAVYNEIANDLLEFRRTLKAGELRHVRQVSRLRFAADLAPVPFGSYLSTTKKGRLNVTRLPADDDPIMARIDDLRASEGLFIDTLDQSHAAFYETMNNPYDSWRKYTFEEEQAYKALRRKAMTQKILGGLAILGAVFADPGSQTAAVLRDAAVIGGMAAIHAGIATSGEAKIHSEAIRELGASVDAELQPVVLEVEGRTLRLEGTAVTQYDEWRRLLREIWANETGLPRDPNLPGDQAGRD